MSQKSEVRSQEFFDFAVLTEDASILIMASSSFKRDENFGAGITLDSIITSTQYSVSLASFKAIS
jgi:hypothetical protein